LFWFLFCFTTVFTLSIYTCILRRLYWNVGVLLRSILIVYHIVLVVISLNFLFQIFGQNKYNDQRMFLRYI
jgi:hypothetical protein